MATRIHVLLARDAPVAAIFRRGPTKQVRLLRWDLRTDEITGGQWLAGRVYDGRCDLSPDGELLVYFAMRKGHTWTAISRPPYFTPLAVWDEQGTWGGGGTFTSNRRVLLRTNPACMTLDPKFTLPDGFVVDWITADDRTPREGTWTHREPEAEDTTTPSGKPRQLGRYTPSIRSRVRPGQSTMMLEAHPVVVEDPYGPPESCEYVLRDLKNDRLEVLGELDWADWDRNGDLLHAREGELLRARLPQRRIDDVKTVARLADDRFCAMPPPPEAHQWPRSAREREPRSRKGRKDRSSRGPTDR